ncbi:MAG TPA: hypothetical protein VKB89_15920 [Xanthobacteraceae bacterium]|nr:hypothetical protein [Xanthobacteraceae bacterium]
MSWRLIGPSGYPVLQDDDASIVVLDPPSAGIVRIAVPHEKTAALPAGLYFDALQVSLGDRLAAVGGANSRGR